MDEKEGSEMIYKTVPTNKKHIAIAYLDNLLRQLRADGLAIISVYLVPENVPTGVESYQYAVITG